MLIQLFLLVGLIHSTQAVPCFTRTFCSEGEAPKYISCGKGADCSKEKDRGIQFESNCNVTWNVGDTANLSQYQIENNIVAIQVRLLNQSPPAGEKFRLSPDGQRLFSINHPKHVYSVSACNDQISVSNPVSTQQLSSASEINKEIQKRWPKLRSDLDSNIPEVPGRVMAHGTCGLFYNESKSPEVCDGKSFCIGQRTGHFRKGFSSNELSEAVKNFETECASQPLTDEMLITNHRKMNWKLIYCPTSSKKSCENSLYGIKNSKGLVISASNQAKKITMVFDDPGEWAPYVDSLFHSSQGEKPLIMDKGMNHSPRCFTRTFCSEGTPEPNKCGVGVGCMKKYRELKFTSDCKITWTIHGEVPEKSVYEVNPEKAVIIFDKDTQKGVCPPTVPFRLSPDGHKLFSIHHPKQVFSENACTHQGSLSTPEPEPKPRSISEIKQEIRKGWPKHLSELDSNQPEVDHRVMALGACGLFYNESRSCEVCSGNLFCVGQRTGHKRHGFSSDELSEVIKNFEVDCTYQPIVDEMLISNHISKDWSLFYCPTSSKKSCGGTLYGIKDSKGSIISSSNQAKEITKIFNSPGVIYMY